MALDSLGWGLLYFLWLPFPCFPYPTLPFFISHPYPVLFFSVFLCFPFFINCYILPVCWACSLFSDSTSAVTFLLIWFSGPRVGALSSRTSGSLWFNFFFFFFGPWEGSWAFSLLLFIFIYEHGCCFVYYTFWSLKYCLCVAHSSRAALIIVILMDRIGIETPFVFLFVVIVYTI